MKKVVSILLSVIFLMFTILPGFASAGSFTIETSELQIIPDNIINISYLGEEEGSISFLSKQTIQARDTLTDDEKEIYDYFRNAPFGTTEYYVEYLDYYSAPTYEQFKKLDIGKILNALMLDCPDLFYIEWGEYAYSWYETAISDEDVFDEGDSLYALQITVCYDETMGDIYELKDRVNTELSTLNLDGCRTRYEAVKRIHDFICEKTQYDYDYLNNFDINNPQYVKHNIIGTLLDGLCVCQGYSETFKLICDIYKIPCTCISGQVDGVGHAWNAVLMDDGIWYLVDVTWDDGDFVTTDYFLEGVTKFNYTRHKEVIYNFSPRINYSKTKFTAIHKETEFQATFNHKLLEKDGCYYLCRSIFDINEPIYYNGISINEEKNQVFDTPSTGYCWNLIFMGDLNNDFECTVEDYAEAVRLALSDGEENIAADMDFDGYIDVLDVVIIERIQSGAISNFNLNQH